MLGTQKLQFIEPQVSIRDQGVIELKHDEIPSEICCRR